MVVNLHKHKALYCQEANCQYIASAVQIYCEPSRCGHTLVTATGGLLDNVFDWVQAAAGSLFRWDGDITQTVAERQADLARINAKMTEGVSPFAVSPREAGKAWSAWVTSVS